LESQLLNALEKLKTSRLIIELLMEDVKPPGEISEDAACTRIGEIKTSLNENTGKSTLEEYCIPKRPQ
jgi:hypothetical protein